MPSPKKKKTTPSTTASAFNVDQIEQEVVDLITKHYAGGSVNILDDALPTDPKGFFLIFIKRDDSDEKGRLKTRTFGHQMTMRQIMAAFQDTIVNIMEADNQKVVGEA